MVDYTLQLKYPEDFPMPLRVDGSDIKDKAGVTSLINDALSHLIEAGVLGQKPSETQIRKTGVLLELALGCYWDFDLDRFKLIGHLIENAKRQKEILDHIVAGLKKRGYLTNSGD